MSRIIPMDQALTDEDRRYLRDRGAFGQATEERLDAMYPPDPEDMAAFEVEERKRAAAGSGVALSPTDQTSLIEENARLKAQLAALEGDSAPAAPNYDGWSKADLEAEVDRVNAEDSSAKLAKGTVGDMKAALTAYFAS